MRVLFLCQFSVLTTWTAAVRLPWVFPHVCTDALSPPASCQQAAYSSLNAPLSTLIAWLLVAPDVYLVGNCFKPNWRSFLVLNSKYFFSLSIQRINIINPVTFFGISTCICSSVNKFHEILHCCTIPLHNDTALEHHSLRKHKKLKTPTKTGNCNLLFDQVMSLLMSWLRNFIKCDTLNFVLHTC